MNRLEKTIEQMVSVRARGQTAAYLVVFIGERGHLI